MLHTLEQNGSLKLIYNIELLLQKKEISFTVFCGWVTGGRSTIRQQFFN